MKFYRKEIKSHSGDVISRDYFEHGIQVGELTAGEIKHFPEVFEAYQKELKDAGKEPVDLAKYFEPGSLELDVRADSAESGLPSKVVEPTQPDTVDANGNVIKSASPDAEANAEAQEGKSSDPHVDTNKDGSIKPKELERIIDERQPKEKEEEDEKSSKSAKKK